MASKYIIEVKGWPGHPHEYTAHTEQEAIAKAQELVSASNAEGVDLRPQGHRHHGGTPEHWTGTNENGHPREIKIVVGEAHSS